MKFKILENLQSEIVHFYESDTKNIIKSTGNNFSVVLDGQEVKFSIPGKNRFLMRFRLIRRFLRYDKSNAILNWKRDGVVILYQWKIYFFDLRSNELNFIDNLKQCRNVLHGGIAVTASGIFFGEYGHNASRDSVPIWKSCDDGRSFSIVKELHEHQIKHIHGVYVDKFSDSLWIVTGDFDGECFLIESDDENFFNLTWYGDGTQQWRPVSLFFTPEKILWAMDSPIHQAYLQSFDRATKLITQGQYFPGPVWYSKQFDSGDAVLQTSVEPGKEVKTNDAILYHSHNLIEWTEVIRFKKDILPMMFFKFGVISFAEGAQSSKDFILFGEGLVDLEGTTIRASID
jgi:hypothetical protein